MQRDISEITINEFRHKKNNENSKAYAVRCANELEQKIESMIIYIYTNLGDMAEW